MSKATKTNQTNTDNDMSGQSQWCYTQQQSGALNHRTNLTIGFKTETNFGAKQKLKSTDKVPISVQQAQALNTTIAHHSEAKRPTHT